METHFKAEQPWRKQPAGAQRRAWRGSHLPTLSKSRRAEPRSQAVCSAMCGSSSTPGRHSPHLGQAGPLEQREGRAWGSSHAGGLSFKGLGMCSLHSTHLKFPRPRKMSSKTGLERIRRQGPGWVSALYDLCPQASRKQMARPAHTPAQSRWSTCDLTQAVVFLSVVCAFVHLG